MTPLKFPRFLGAMALLLWTSFAFAQSARDPIPLETVQKPNARRARNRPRSAPTSKPDLVVFLVADQFRLDYLRRFSAGFGEGGFKRLLREGAVFDGHYGQQNTYTGPGHALIISGSYAYQNGIMQNKWWNREQGRSEAMLFDPAAKLLKGETTPEDETSPRNFLGSTLGDELRLASPQSKVVTLALKDRGAILLGGRMGTAYFMSDATGEMTSSTYYMQALPEWVSRFNARKIPDAAFGRTWERLLPLPAYVGADDFKHEGDASGLGRVFPHRLAGKSSRPDASYYGAFQHSPFGIDLTFEFARSALDGERLGQRGDTDILGISVTPTDYAGHVYGPYSHEVQDLVVRLDRAVEDFLKELDKRFKPGRVLVVFTADHGAVAVPEYAAERRIEAKRVKKATIKTAITKALDERFGSEKWVIALEDPSVYLDRAIIAKKKLDPAEVERVAGEAAASVPGILGYHTRTQLMNGWLPPTEAARAVARSYVPKRSGDVVLVQAPFSFWGKYGEKDWGETHGSAYRYDTDVPLVFFGQGVRPGLWGQAEQVDIAATLARFLGLPMPAACEGESHMDIFR